MNRRPYYGRTTLIASAFLALFAGVVVFGQSPQQKESSPQNTASASVLRVTARLVQVNVIAQDKDGKPVTNLTKDDFTIQDEGAPQKITFFAPLTSAPPVSTASVSVTNAATAAN